MYIYIYIYVSHTVVEFVNHSMSAKYKISMNSSRKKTST